ncbi:MAG: carboxypeptidase regulatory-like domain-containing protein [Pseudomonadota bacterium]
MRHGLVTLLFVLAALSGCSGDGSDGAGRDAAGDTASAAAEGSSEDGFYSGDYDEDDPLGNRTLELDYPEPPYPPDERILGEFMQAFAKGDLDGITEAWLRMGPEQRLKALEQGQEYRFSIPYDDHDRLDAVQTPFDLLGRVSIGQLEADARADARGEPRWRPGEDQGPELPDELGHVRGVVIDRETGEPLASVTVAASFPQMMLFAMIGDTERWETLTADDGRFEIRDIPAGKAALIVHRLPEYNLLQHDFTIEADRTAAETVELPKLERVKLELPTFLSGTVIDSDTGEPVPDVLVAIGNSSMTGRSNSQGAYIIRKVAAGEHTVLARHQDYHEGSNTIVADSPGKIELDFAIDPITTGIVVGTAVNRVTGKVLANVSVTIAGQTVTTDAEGRFRIADIESGDVRVQAGSEGFRPAGNDVTLEARTTAETVLELEPITEGTVRGIVRNATTGESVAGTDIRVGTFDTITDDAGRFEIANVPQGDANVAARKTLFEPAIETVDVIAMQSVSVDIALQPITYGDLVVIVTDASNGRPLAAASVRLPGSLSGETDARGRIRFDKVPAGEGSLSAVRHAYVTGERNYVLEPATELEQAIALEPVTVGSLSGIVVNATTRAPLAGATVSIGSRGVTTNDQGRFVLDELAAGDVNVSAGKPVFETDRVSATVIAAETVEIELSLEPITYGTIRGVVVDAVTSEPVADAVVAVAGRNTRTNAAGEFELERVAAGNLMLTADKRIYEQVEDRFELAPAETETRRIALPPITYGDVRGRVVDADSGAPLAGVDVSLGTTRVRTDAQGRFGPQRIDAGPLNLSAQKGGYESGGASVEVAPAAVTDSLIELEPIRIGTVVGTVVDAKTGEPVGGARVTLARSARETEADGSFRFDDVRTGSVGVAVRHADYGNGAASGDLAGGATLELIVQVDLRREDVTQLEAGLASGGSIDLYGIHFDSGKDQFKSSSLGTLNAVLEVMKRAPERNFTIVGHTDSDGGDASNQDLSERRARTVINWLIERGIEARRLTANGFGESRPTAPNETESGKALNRRVELGFTE